MFAIGLFSQTQIWIMGSIAISELVFFMIAPMVFMSHYNELRRNGILNVLRLIALAMVGCVISSLVNRTQFSFAIKGFAALYGLWSGIVIFYLLLVRRPSAFKWFLLGACFSYVLCSFVFQQGVEMSKAMQGGYSGSDMAEGIMSGPIYWIGRLSGFVTWPIQGLYLKCPLAYSVIGTFVFGAWALLTTSSGRSAALISSLSCALILIGRKSRQSMYAIRHWFWGLIFIGFALVFVFKSVYGYTASHGMLGEEAQKKYEVQTKGRGSTMSILKGGRTEVFIGFYACTMRPFIGYGPWAIDRGGVVAEYLQKYGDAEDAEWYLRRAAYVESMGGFLPVPAHSCIVGWWQWYGIFGLPFWIYLLYLIYRCIRYDVAFEPAFFGYFAVMLPGQMWNIFFSPFGGRLPWAFFVAMILLVRTLKERDVMGRNMRIMRWRQNH